MGHTVNSEREYRLLQQRLDLNITGAPYSPIFIEILKLLFSPHEAEIARKIPLKPIKLRTLAVKINIPADELQEQIISMAERGLVLDFEHNNECYVVLAPVVIGFFEFVFMRSQGNLPLTELAQMFDEYMFKDDRFALSVFEEQTQLGRVLAREETLAAGDYSEVLDWEKASAIIQTAKLIGVSLCACRHKAGHLGKSCNAPQQTCFTLNGGAEMLIKRGMAEKISVSSALQILQECKAYGLAQIGDNVQQNVGFICNCCGCCCGMFQAMKKFNIKNAIVTSGWIAELDEIPCKGCGACVQACPADAIHKTIEKTKVTIEKEVCLGCGVCQAACKFGCIRMQKRSQRVLVPETAFDKYVAMAIERGKLTNFIFDDPSLLSHRMLGRIASVLEKSTPVKALLAIKPLRSAFLEAVAKGAKKF